MNFTGILFTLTKTPVHQLQKSLSILFISLLTLFQYGRILSYLECRIAAAATDPTLKCDCERQLMGTATPDGPSTTERALSKPRPEELFTSILLPVMNTALAQRGRLPAIPASYPLSAGHCGALFQPPRS